MTTLETDKISQRKAALIAGIAIIMMAICSGITYGAIHSSLFIHGDAVVNMNKLMESAWLLRAEIFGWLVILLCDVIVAWALYLFLKQINESLSLLGAWLRIVYSAILGMAVTNLISPLLMLPGNGASVNASTEPLKVQLMFYVESFNSIWSLGLILFGVHLLVVGYLVVKSNVMPKFLGILLLIAAFSYILIHSFHLFIPEIEKMTLLFENILSLPMAVGELALGVWLLLKGGKAPRTEN